MIRTFLGTFPLQDFLATKNASYAAIHFLCYAYKINWRLSLYSRSLAQLLTGLFELPPHPLWLMCNTILIRIFIRLHQVSQMASPVSSQHRLGNSCSLISTTTPPSEETINSEITNCTTQSLILKQYPSTRHTTDLILCRVFRRWKSLGV